MICRGSLVFAEHKTRWREQKLIQDRLSQFLQTFNRKGETEGSLLARDSPSPGPMAKILI